MNKTLEGVRMLDLTHMLSGPYGSMILADLGADTIKVEPLHGEGTRKLLASDPKNSLEGMGAYYLTLNRNKKSVAIDLKSEQGLEVFYQLVKKSDIVISNFGAGVTKKLNIDYDKLKEINPRIISCTISGFGSEGPSFKRPSFDMVAQAFGGGMSITGPDQDHPVRAGIPVGDLGGGMFGVMGVLGALFEREKTGLGQHVDISMADGQLSMLNYMVTMASLSGEDPHPIGNSHFVHVPYNAFKCSDGFIVVCVITDNFWKNLNRVLKHPEFDDPKYDGQPGRWEAREFIEKTINEILSTETVDHWRNLFEQERIPCAPVNSISQAMQDEQMLHRNMVIDLKHPSGVSTKGPGNPIKLSRNNNETFTPAPTLGQDTNQVLNELLNMTDVEIANMKAAGVIG
ncbi:MAG: CoA transferase [Acidiferrobacterales bacterium]|nr:CoA transferase [Acidiferrobacterales bacterium]